MQNEQQIINALYDGIVVRVCFDVNDSRAFHYKCDIPNVKVGDLVLILAPQNYVRSVRVSEVVEDFDFNPNIKYNWVIDKIDLTAYREKLANEKKIIESLRKAKRANIRKQLIENSGLGVEELQNILTSGNRIGNVTILED